MHPTEPAAATDETPGPPPGGWTRRRVLRATGLALGAAVLGGGAYAYHRFHGYAEILLHWRGRRNEEVPPGAFRLVALGDSSTLGFGADRAEDSFVGRAETHVTARTGLPVAVRNLAVGGASAQDVLQDQVPEADLEGADLVLVSVGSTEAGGGVPLPEFTRSMGALLDALPARVTVLSDVAAVPGYGPYKRAAAELADARGIARADFDGAFRAARRFDVMSDDGVHVNSVGYGIWFDAFRPRIDAILAGTRPA